MKRLIVSLVLFGLALSVSLAQGKKSDEGWNLNSFLIDNQDAKIAYAFFVKTPELLKSEKAKALKNPVMGILGKANQATGMSFYPKELVIDYCIQSGIDSSKNIKLEYLIDFMRTFKGTPGDIIPNLNLVDTMRQKGKYPGALEDVIASYAGANEVLVRKQIGKMKKSTLDLNELGEEIIEAALDNPKEAWLQAKRDLSKAKIEEVLDALSTGISSESFFNAMKEIKVSFLKEQAAEIDKMSEAQLDKLGLYRKQIQIVWPQSTGISARPAPMPTTPATSAAKPPTGKKK